ncbi:MAG TPA: chemotaxis protein CheW [Thermoleophilaceae bacterium]|jgi:purine-binding chemotaxis protein CheW
MSTPAVSDSETASAVATQLVVFRIAKSEYGLAVGSVMEVLRMVALTPVPEAPDWLTGVINLRGTVIPVIDLRTRLGLTPQPAGLSTPIIVAEVAAGSVGLIADSVADFVNVPGDAIDPPAARAGDTGAVAGLARSGERLILILDLDNVCAGAQPLAAP